MKPQGAHRISSAAWVLTAIAVLTTAGLARAQAASAPATVPAQQPAAPSSGAPPGQPAGATSGAPSAQPPTDEPRVHHAPISTAPAGERLTLRADVENRHRVRKAWVLWRSARQAAFQVAELQLTSSPRSHNSLGFETTEVKQDPPRPYLASIAADQVAAPWIEYCIELETVDGRTVTAFASREHPFRIAVPEGLEDLREAALLARLNGRRSIAQASGEFVYFGDTTATLVDPATQESQTKPIADRYWRSEAGYTYRPLGIVQEFSIRAGVVRGQSVVPGSTDEADFQVGLNYASPRVRFRLADPIHLETEMLTSVTEVGFSVGAGGALLIGDPYGTKMTFGFETVQTFGTRFYSRMDIAATDSVVIAPIIEVTDMPHADRYGVRLLTELRLDAGAGFLVAVRGGYQARSYTSGGPSAGATLGYSF